MDLADYFRGVRPWAQLRRFLDRLPVEGHYHSARAMDFELAEAILDNEPEKSIFDDEVPAEKPVISPLGYSQQTLLLMQVVEAIRGMDWTLKRVNGNKPTYPTPFPRPTDARAILRARRDAVEVDEALLDIGVQL